MSAAPEEIYLSTEDGKQPKLHRHELTMYAPTLSAAFDAKAHTHEDRTRVLRMRNATVDTLRMFVRWINGNTLYEFDGRLSNNPWIFLALALFAEEWEINPLYNAALDAAFKSSRNRKVLPASIVNYLYKVADKESAVRKFVVDLILFDCKVETHRNEKIWPVMLGYSPEVLVHCIAVLHPSKGPSLFDMGAHLKG